ncbi:MAG TPA: DUF4192 domain-containing protein [Micromonosporaceae bacterium]|nr:DUF4192 domain-containing protein [Micromonosporaceae bacterium]
MTDTVVPRLRIRFPADLLAAVPYLVGFHPADSVVVVGVRGEQLALAVRSDLPPVPSHVAGIVAKQAVDATTIIGYGPAHRVGPAALGVRDALLGRGIDVYDVLRVTDGRYWSYACDNPSCCPAEGTPFDPVSSPVAAQFAYHGQEALPSRAALVARVAPVDGPARESMRQATARAQARLDQLVAGAARQVAGEGRLAAGVGRRAAGEPEPAEVGRLMRAAGAEAVTAALTRHGAGTRLTDDEVAWLTVLLGCVAVRDLAWQRIDESRLHIGVWTDVVQRAEPHLAAPPASLLAFAAWRLGEGALAVVALERALRADPGYSLATLLDRVLRQGIAPTAIAGWPDPSGRSSRARRSRARRRAGR